ncbi:LDLR chaperone boca [Armadillidium nasatum]|uniref:LDLR chaperone boca n=1 Tax=Armadillidium nasatum TaxID=96803 RepID=A0A5N5SPN2_9CRUS|nr:LDLR chaperone boca [Armadillidium nasatum]
MEYQLLLITVSGLLILHLQNSFCKKFSEDEKPEWAKKDIRDYSEADLERLLDQWEEDEEPLPPDELPEHLRPQPNIQFDPNNIGDPENLLKLSKKGKTLMMFVRTKEEFSPEEATAITQRWQTSLWNSHIQAERYMVDDKRAIFMFKDGSLAWEAKDFLIEQEELLECTLENRSYYGKYTPEVYML